MCKGSGRWFNQKFLTHQIKISIQKNEITLQWSDNDINFTFETTNQTVYFHHLVCFCFIRLGGASSSSRYATTGICQCQNRSHVWRIFVFFSSLVERKNIHEKRKLNCRLNQLEFHLTTVHFFSKQIWCLEGAARDRLGKSHARTKRNWHLKKGDGRKKSVHSCVCVAYSLLIAIVTVKK